MEPEKTHVQKMWTEKLLVTSIYGNSRDGENENSGQASYCRYVVHAVAPIWVGFPEEIGEDLRRKNISHRG